MKEAAGPGMKPHIPVVYVEESMIWQYIRISRNLEKDEAPAEEELNKLGEQGWELCGIFSQKSFVHFYFKRPSK
jgi:hypothetical protein